MALSSRLRRLQEELAALQEGRRPLGAFLDPDLGRQAEGVRGRREASLQADAGGAAAQAIRRLGKIERGREQFPGRRPGGTGSTGLDRTDREGYLRLLGEQREGADLEAALSGRPAPTVQVQPSTLRGVRKIGTGGGRPRVTQEEFNDPNVDVSLDAPSRQTVAANRRNQDVETAGARDERIQSERRSRLQQERQEEADARAAEAEAKGAEQAARTPLEREQDFASVKQFRGRKGVRELPAVRGVRRFGTTAEPVEPPGDPEQEMLERLTSGGTDIPSNVAQSLISRGTQRERLEQQKTIRDANEKMRRDIADAGNDVALKQLAVRRWEAELRAAGLGVGLEVNATRFGQVDAPGAFTGSETAPNIQSALDEFGNLRRAGPQGEGDGDTATTREEAIEALRAAGVTDPTEEDILELLGR